MVKGRSAGGRRDSLPWKANNQHHHVLSRAVWSGLEVSAILLRVLLKTFDGGGSLVLGIDETIERRRGEEIAAKGIHRDPVRSSHRHFVKASGLRWVSGHCPS